MHQHQSGYSVKWPASKGRTAEEEAKEQADRYDWTTNEIAWDSWECYTGEKDCGCGPWGQWCASEQLWAKCRSAKDSLWTPEQMRKLNKDLESRNATKAEEEK